MDCWVARFDCWGDGVVGFFFFFLLLWFVVVADGGSNSGHETSGLC